MQHQSNGRKRHKALEKLYKVQHETNQSKCKLLEDLGEIMWVTAPIETNADCHQA